MPPNTLRVRTEYALVKSVRPKVSWAESRVQETGEYFPPLQFHTKIVAVEIGGAAIYRSFENFSKLNRTVLVWWPRPMTGVLLASCHDEFLGPRSDCVIQVALETTLKNSGVVAISPVMVSSSCSGFSPSSHRFKFQCQ
ncbi:uncharacterized protein TNCV_799561 [Trichonephila clavipes]|nr:uncharacterized protein TNCV_799561 [Trichonephila clavipes]